MKRLVMGNSVEQAKSRSVPIEKVRMKINWEHLLQNKFNYLLITEVVILIAYPLLQTSKMKLPIVPLLLLIAIAPALWVGLSRKIFLAVFSVGVFAFLLNLVVSVTAKDLAEEGLLVLLTLYAVFFFLAIVILITKISSGATVSADTIKGGISIYFLLGLFWAILYMILLTFDLSALTNVSKETVGLDCYYYSFATLTTLGYGDITPVADYAKILAILEAVTGPVYLAIFVAQIIGMNIAQKMKG
ncbi:MAG: hypothetical protein DRP56_08110 [Planctomycetota bacterium]|nr:MAG: hypothetical protein DRP56_08110 [Planctomycetota bacterium]